MQAVCKNLPDKVRLQRFKGCLGISALMQTDVAPPCIQCNLKFGKSSEKFPSSMIYQGQVFSLLTNFESRPATLHFVLIFLKHCLKDFLKTICRNARCVKPDDCMSKSIRNRQIPLPPLPRRLENHILKFVPLGVQAALVEILLKYFTPSFKWVCHCKTSGRELCKFGGI